MSTSVHGKTVANIQPRSVVGVSEIARRITLCLLLGMAWCTSGSEVNAQPPGQGGTDEYGSSQDDYGGADMEMEMEMEMEMDSGDEYGSSYGGPSSRSTSPSGRAGGSGDTSNAMMQSYQTSLTSLLGSLDLGPLMAPPDQFGPPVDAGPVLEGQAKTAYTSGNYPLALQLYFAHLVTEFDGARVNLQAVKYSKLLRRPVWQIRWGVSYTVRGDAGASDPNPIRAGKLPNMRMAQRGGGGQGDFGQGDFDQGGFDQGGQDQEMEMQMQMEMEQEQEMSMEMEMDMGGGPQRGTGNRGPGGFGGGSAAPAPIQRTMLSSTAKEEMDKYLGLVAELTAEEFGSRYRQGDFGPALCTVAASDPVDDAVGNAPRVGGNAAPASFDSARGPVDDLLAESPETLPLWAPGIMFLGQGESKSIVQSAAREGIDLILHFDVVLKSNRNSDVQNVSRCRLLHVGSGKSLAVSKGIDSFELAQLARAGRTDERSYVTEKLSGLFLVIDRQVKTTDMPKLTPEVAKRRVATLLSATGHHRLPALAEVRLYQAQELLPPEDVEMAFDIVGSQDGLTLLHGAQEAKLKIAHEWALSSLPKSGR
ncbi:MAG: hypothetical protein HKN47_01690 [Pirellulaceae bacterium]|nr:hypothetical protein [Pirellulaceae bacterium]